MVGKKGTVIPRENPSSISLRNWHCFPIRKSPPIWRFASLSTRAIQDDLMAGLGCSGPNFKNLAMFFSLFASVFRHDSRPHGLYW